MDDCIENRDCEQWDLVPEPPRPSWYKRLYYRAADRVWHWRWRIAEKIAGCRIECW